MKTKMIVHLADGHIKVFEFETDYTGFEIKEGNLTIQHGYNIEMIYAKGFWNAVEFNRSQ